MLFLEGNLLLLEALLLPALVQLGFFVGLLNFPAEGLFHGRVLLGLLLANQCLVFGA